MSRILFDGLGRERVGEPAERFAASTRPSTGDVVVVAPVGEPRDFLLEREWTLQAGRSTGASVEELVAFAERRAGTRPVRDLANRDFARETLEELADARNYLVWWAQQASNAADPDGELTALIGRSLEAVTVAFETAWRARDRQRGV